MNKPKYQVFISSPFKDLGAQRAEAIQAVLNWEHLPSAFEGITSKAKKVDHVIEQMIKESQIYILILGHRYGSIVGGMDISYTEMEFNIAKENDLDILSFLLDLDEARKKIWRDKSIGNKDIEFDRLTKFHDRVKS